MPIPEQSISANYFSSPLTVKVNDVVPLLSLPRTADTGTQD